MSEEKIYPSMVIRSQAEAIELLQQENQQLKEENKDMKRTIELFSKSLYNCDLKYYKTVLNELREKILEMMSRGRGSFLGLLEILDKVKE